MTEMFSIENEELQFMFKDTISLVLLSVLFVVIVIWWFTREEKKNFPPGPYCLPLFGYFPFLGKDPFRTLDALGKKYGKVYSIRLFGPLDIVVITDYESFKEAFSKSEILDRPPGIFDFLPSGSGGFPGANGKLWIEQRRFVMKSVRNLGIGKGPWETAISDEMLELIKLLRTYKGESINARLILASSVSRNIASLLLSKPIEPDSPTSKFISECVEASLKVITFGVNFFGFPCLLNFLINLNVAGVKKNWKVMERFTEFLRKEIEEKKQITSDHYPEDFIGSYLEEMKKRKDEDDNDHTFKEGNLQTNMLGIFLAGSDTTRTALEWLFVAMVNHPDIQQKIYLELETVLGEKKAAQWEDRARLPWTYATIMEGQRWRTISPLNVLRMANEDIQIGGYDIPRGTAILAILWSLHNDTRYWKDPEKFDPSRFIKEDGTLDWKKESYAPFSMGKRNCPGENIALMEILIYFSGIIRNFEIQAENFNGKFDVPGISGVTYEPVEHEIRFIPREK